MRALTFNIRHGVGLDGVHDLERVAAVIEAAAPDVVALQEVDRHLSRTDHVDQAGWLAGRLGFDVTYGPVVDLGPVSPALGLRPGRSGLARSLALRDARSGESGDSGPDGARRQYGIALLSRAPLEEARNLLLTRPKGGEQRGLLGAAIAVEGRRVRVFCTHLQHRSRTERLAQATQIAESLAAAGGPVVVMGDLNARPGDPEIAPLTAVLDDAWAVAGDGAGFTFDAATPHARIDYVLTSDDVVARHAAVIDTDASDHLPVLADLELASGG